jgi:hypothetical protein
MKYLTTSTEYDKSVCISPKNFPYTQPICFHSLWDGELNEKVYISMKSCWYFHHSSVHTRILWRTNSIPNEWDEKIKSYCELKELDDDIIVHNDDNACFHILYKYGGIFFPPSVFFLSSIESLLSSYSKFIMTHHTGCGKYITKFMISMQPNDERLKKMLDAGLHSSNALTGKEIYDDLLVLPCSWFDGASLDSKYMKKERYFELFKTLPSAFKPIKINEWFKGSITMNWHNEWETPIESNSVVEQLSSIMI